MVDGLSSRAAKDLQPSDREQWGQPICELERDAEEHNTAGHKTAFTPSPGEHNPQPAGQSGDRGSIVEGPWERSDLSVTNLKKFHSLHITVSPSSSLFLICLLPPTQGNDQGHATIYLVQCY